MPEGPEIRRAADRVARVLDGQVAHAVTFGLSLLAKHGPRLSGRRVLGVESRGKALLLHFEGGTTVYTHNQLYGVWRVSRAGKVAATTRQLRLALHTATHAALLYSASEIEVWKTAEVGTHPYLAKLGVDLVHPDTTPAAVRAQAGAARFAKRCLAALLLDQGYLAGMGNYLRSEALFVAGLHPAQRPADLPAAAVERLADACLQLARQSYRTRGITNDLERARGLKAAGMAFGEYRHHVFDRAGEPCWACGTDVQRTDDFGRAVFLCPQCQSAGDGGGVSRATGPLPRRAARRQYG